MLKKVILLLILLLVAATVSYLVRESNQLKKIVPEVMASTKGIYINACEENSTCIDAIEQHFSECQLDNTMLDVHVMNFQKKYVKFMVDTHSCIDHKSNYKLPRFMDFMKEKDASRR